MKTMKKKLMTLVTSAIVMTMVLGTGITAYAAGDQSQNGRVPVAVAPGVIYAYGCYYDDFVRYPLYTTDFPVEYLLAIAAAGITNEMSDYDKCMRINNYLCINFECGFADMESPHVLVGADGMTTIIDDNRAGGPKGASPYGWEVQQAQEQAKIQQNEQLLDEYDKAITDLLINALLTNEDLSDIKKILMEFDWCM